MDVEKNSKVSRLSRPSFQIYLSIDKYEGDNDRS